MEPQQQQQHNHQLQQNQLPNEEIGCSSKSSYLCRQSSTRWTPTTDQIRILKELYYNNGVRSPSAEQIQRISARLRQYGKIEGKNVFYWFQNHKARERQKSRFTTDHHFPIQRAVLNGSWRSEDATYNMYPNISPGIPSPSGVLTSTVGQMGSFGYGSGAMEKSFRDCSISTGGYGGGSTAGHTLGLVGFDPYTTAYPFLENKKSVDETLEYDQDQDEQNPEIETLPLFPMHGDQNISGYLCNNKPESESYYTGWYRSDDSVGRSRASLELSLNFYTGRSPDSI